MACANISDDEIGFTSHDYLKVIKIVSVRKSGVRTDYLLRFEGHPRVPDEWYTYPIKGCLSRGVFNRCDDLVKAYKSRLRKNGVFIGSNKKSAKEIPIKFKFF